MDLITASKNGDIEEVIRLLEHGADVNAKDDDQSTPLRLAAIYGHVEVAKVLLENGADVNAKDQYQNTPLYTRLLIMADQKK